jgi:SurA N-terminal domain/PPIC-type PPIASE domain
MKKRFRRVKKVKEMIPDNLAERAMTLNPLSSPEPQDVEKVPRITNETITEHREDVLKGARKYIYPLQHSKHRIVVVTLSLVSVAAVVFLTYCILGLYHFRQHNTFLYRVTQVVPFPIAKTQGSYVAYENYLFELRHYIHYYQSQQQLNFDGNEKQQLERLKQQALTTVIDQAIVKKIASRNGVGVSGKEIDTRISEVRNQNRLGNNDKVFADVLRDYWGWSVSDFKRSLKQQILTEKVAAKLDKTANQKAQEAYAKVKSGGNFTDLAKAYSNDPSAATNGGEFGFAITKTNPNVPPEVVHHLFKLKTGEVSGIILASPVISGAPPTLQIVKVNQTDGKTVSAQHIVFNLVDTSTYVADIKTKNPPKYYTKF